MHTGEPSISKSIHLRPMTICNGMQESLRISNLPALEAAAVQITWLSTNIEELRRSPRS
jgi:hypothetical protein